MKQYRYDFSVIMSVYQVSDFLKEAVESLIHQTIGFSRIQLIMVDDGSTDGSGIICDEYKKKYPENIVVVHKDNGGLSSARNVGLPLIEGRYVSFLDPDDTLPHDTFNKVRVFMDQHPEVDLSCIPIFYFGDMSGPHHLNYKFDEGTRVIDLSLDENSHYILLSAATAFYRSKVIKDLQFDTKLYTAEDAKENLRILMANPKLGVIANTSYNYRKHGNSVLDKSKYTSAWYLDYLNRFSLWALDFAEEKNGFIPKFVQYTVMNDLQWKFNQGHIPDGVLSEQELNDYKKILFNIIHRIDDDIILGQDEMFFERKLYLLLEKNGFEPSSWKSINLQDALSELSTVICFIHVTDEYLCIEGYQTIPFQLFKSAKITAILNEHYNIDTSFVDYKETVFSADIPIASRYYFKANIPIESIRKEKEIDVVFACIYDDIFVIQKNIRNGLYAPITTELKHSWSIEQGCLLHLYKKGVRIKWVGAHHLLQILKNEIVLLFELLRKESAGTKKAIIARLLYRLLHLIAPQNIWLIADKADRADDNGEAFFKYIISLGEKAKCIPVFAIGKNSSDYKRLKKYGHIVPYMSWRHKMIHLLAKHTISAYSHDEISTPFRDYTYLYADLQNNNRIIFLQHGITKDDVSKNLNRYHKNFSLFITSVMKERDSILNGNYGYTSEQVVLTGFPRFDYLHDNKKKFITVMPTWVRKLCGRYLPESSRWELLPGFEKSEYYKFYSELLNNKELLNTADQLGYKVRFLIHPVFQPYINLFHFDKRVDILDSNTVYKDVFAESSLITTDYSSVAFDFAYLKKPVLYTQFDLNHYEEGYFNYERDGFGEVVHTVDDAVKMLISYMHDGCILKDCYKQRIEDFFCFNDNNNCERVYNAIIEMDDKE